MPNVLLPMRLCLLFGLSFVVGGCSVQKVRKTDLEATVASNVVLYPGIDPELGEHLYLNEKMIAEELSVVIENSIRKQYSPGSARRDAHPKAHGCVKADVHILKTLPDRLAKGMFIPGKTYKAWIRFSNGSGDPTRADIKRDARGMAIKVLGVPGKKLLEDEAEATTQDFIMINHPVFFATDPARYWSMVPYQLGTGAGRQAVKYSARACSGVADPIPKKPGHDFLRDALRNTLLNGGACMELLVQPRTSSSMDVEDSRIEWKEAQAPFYPVATILIPRQVFDAPEQNAFCENLSFTPWHALPEHRPLGVTNRLRKVIYDHISRVRHEMNSANRQEPQ